MSGSGDITVGTAMLTTGRRDVGKRLHAHAQSGWLLDGNTAMTGITSGKAAGDNLAADYRFRDGQALRVRCPFSVFPCWRCTRGLRGLLLPAVSVFTRMN